MAASSFKSEKSTSRPVRSDQTAVHDDLIKHVTKHRNHHWQKPINAGSRVAFESVMSWIDSARPLILDSGCGTGHSVRALAERYADAQVLGMDQSAARLQRAPELPRNARLIRARCEDVWRLLYQADIRLHRHYLLYPNPWPKPAQVKRRWHAHPAFPDLLALGGALELRCNWKIYADEFYAALKICGFSPSPVVSFSPDRPLTLFERKYAQSGHSLYRLMVDLS